MGLSSVCRTAPAMVRVAGTVWRRTAVALALALLAPALCLAAERSISVLVKPEGSLIATQSVEMPGDGSLTILRQADLATVDRIGVSVPPEALAAVADRAASVLNELAARQDVSDLARLNHQVTLVVIADGVTKTVSSTRSTPALLGSIDGLNAPGPRGLARGAERA